ncbi:MAG: bifunctional pyrazinamidase/nicotinamidase [Gammaproteobacteria bacterium]|nr:MAG: bifunctional pyrazinamidase/nicotinamidase [Gammaproteobacteria bacterium]
MKPETLLQKEDALLIVDVQNDFMPGGALPVPEGDRIVPVLNRWIEAARRAGAWVIASRDWHPRFHVSFREQGGPWPEHCVQDTPGAAFHPGLALGPETIVVSKGTRFDRDAYSAFQDTGLEVFLRTRGVRRLWIGGLAQDVCVLHTVLDACRHGFETHWIRDATRPVSAESGPKAEKDMARAGARAVDTA